MIEKQKENYEDWQRHSLETEAEIREVHASGKLFVPAPHR